MSASIANSNIKRSNISRNDIRNPSPTSLHKIHDVLLQSIEGNDEQKTINSINKKQRSRPGKSSKSIHDSDNVSFATHKSNYHEPLVLPKAKNKYRKSRTCNAIKKDLRNLAASNYKISGIILEQSFEGSPNMKMHEDIYPNDSRRYITKDAGNCLYIRSSTSDRKICKRKSMTAEDLDSQNQLIKKSSKVQKKIKKSDISKTVKFDRSPKNQSPKNKNPKDNQQSLNNFGDYSEKTIKHSNTEGKKKSKLDKKARLKNDTTIERISGIKDSNLKSFKTYNEFNTNKINDKPDYGSGRIITKGQSNSKFNHIGNNKKAKYDKVSMVYHAPEQYIDPTSKQIYTEPYQLSCGDIIDRHRTKEYIKENGMKCPLCHKEILEETRKEKELKLEIKEWILSIKKYKLKNDQGQRKLIGVWIDVKGREKLEESQKWSGIVKNYDESVLPRK